MNSQRPLAFVLLPPPLLLLPLPSLPLLQGWGGARGGKAEAAARSAPPPPPAKLPSEAEHLINDCSFSAYLPPSHIRRTVCSSSSLSFIDNFMIRAAEPPSISLPHFFPPNPTGGERPEPPSGSSGPILNEKLFNDFPSLQSMSYEKSVAIRERSIAIKGR